MKDKKKMSVQMKGKIQKLFLMTLTMVTLLYANGFVVYASGNYGQNAANWVLEQAFWIALVVMLIVAGVCVGKKNNIGALVTILVGSVLLFFIKNPTKIEEIGNNIMSNILK